MSESPDKSIPDTYAGKLEPNYYCRAWNAKRGKYCRARAGSGTQHSGVGRCKNHDGGGDQKVVTGLFRRYALTKSKRVQELIEHFESDPEPLNTLPEIAALRALFQDYVERYDQFTDALIAWHESYTTGGNLAPKPKQVLDKADAYHILAEITKAVERVEKAREANHITFPQLKRFLLGIERTLTLRIKDPALINRIREDIFALSVE